MSPVKGSDLYQEADFVKVVDQAGNVQADSVPKAWVGTDLLPAGWKQATAKAAADADKDSPES